jgi:hypothetical protein
VYSSGTLYHAQYVRPNVVINTHVLSVCMECMNCIKVHLFTLFRHGGRNRNAVDREDKRDDALGRICLSMQGILMTPVVSAQVGARRLQKNSQQSSASRHPSSSTAHKRNLSLMRGNLSKSVVYYHV